MKTEDPYKTEQHEEDALDAFLNQFPPAEAPAWFETKMMARLRREKETLTTTPWFNWVSLKLPMTWGIPALALACIALAWVVIPQQPIAPSQAGMPKLIEQPVAPKDLPKEKTYLAQKEVPLNDALDAFFSYNQDQESLWLVDASSH